MKFDVNRGVYKVKKKFIAGTILLLFFLSSIAYSKTNVISVAVNGKKLNLKTNPILVNGTPLVPVNPVFEPLGVKVIWDKNKKQITLRREKTTLTMIIDSKVCYLNGYQVDIAVSPTIYKNQVMVPLKICASYLGAALKLDNKSSTFNIYFRKPTGVQIQEYLKLVDVPELKNVELLPIESGNFWVISDEKKFIYYDTKSSELLNVAELPPKTQLMNTGVLNDGSFMFISSAYDSGKVDINVISYKTMLNRKVGTVNFLGGNTTAISPSGDVIYYDNRSIIKGKYVFSDLWKIGLDGKSIRLTNTQGVMESGPKWSPDGKKVIFQAYSDYRKPRLIVMNSDGTQQKVLQDSIGGSGFYEWAPNGKSVAYTVITSAESSIANKTGKAVIWTIDLVNMKKKKVFEVFDPQYLIWSPDGTQICAALFENIAVAPVNGSWQPNYFGYYPSIYPIWSPDSSKLLFDNSGNLWIAKPALDQANDLMDVGWGYLSWAQNGKSLIFVNDDKIYQANLK